MWLSSCDHVVVIVWSRSCQHVIPSRSSHHVIPSQECRFYPVMPDRASRNSSRAFSGGFEVGLRERSSVRYSRRSHRQTTESAEVCSPIGCSLWQTRPHHSCVKEASLASGEAASDLSTSSTCFTATDQRERYDQSTTMTSKCHQRVALRWSSVTPHNVITTHNVIIAA